jgi:urease accessory protein
MADALELMRLAWFSPAFPVGGYAYSHGIEAAAASGDIRDAGSLADWIEDILGLGSGRNDAILLAEAARRAGIADPAARLAALREIAELALALGLSAERRLETTQQGAAFHALIRAAFPHPDLPEADRVCSQGLAYPIAAGIAGGVHGQPPGPLVAAFLQAFASNLLAAGIRLAIIGQSEAQIRLAALMPLVRTLAGECVEAGPAGLGSMAFRVDLASLRHETLEPRLFRS